VKRNHKFIDRYWVVIGILAIGVLALAIKMSNLTQEPHTSDSEEYQASVEDRIRPLSQVYMPGEEVHAGKPLVVVPAQPEPVATIMSGPQVYNAACIVCHASGIGGAPTMGDDAAWQPRIAKGNDTLYLNAIEGYIGSTGSMPQKGGRLDLSDDEVRSAVDYMVSELQK
jgi:cytochrome c5